MRNKWVKMQRQLGYSLLRGKPFTAGDVVVKEETPSAVITCVIT